MAKAKFERTKPHCNIGTIGHVDHCLLYTSSEELSTLSLHRKKKHLEPHLFQKSLVPSDTLLSHESCHAR